MTGVQVGRLHLPAVVGGDPTSGFGHQPGKMTLSGWYETGAPAVAEHVARQVVALAEGAEDAVPVIDGDRWSGMARVTSADWETVNIRRGIGRWQVEVEPVRDHRLPLCELVVAGGARPSTESLTRRGWAAVPGSATEWSFQPGQSGGDRVDDVRDCEGGSVLYASVAEIYDHVVPFRVSPAKWYEGAATVECHVGGAWLPMVGVGSIDTADAWRVSNGLTRWTVTPDDLIEVEWWRPSTSTWHSPRRFHVRYFSNPTGVRASWPGVEVVKNAPEEVRVRLSGPNARRPGRSDLWVALRRGSTSLDFYARSSATPNWQMQPQPGESITDSGAHAISSAVDGLQWAYTVAGNFYLGTSVGTVGPTPTTAATWSWGLSGVQSAVATWEATEVVRTWYAAQVPRVTVGVS